MSAQHWKFYVGGGFHDPSEGRWIDSFNPTTGKAWAKVPICSDQDVDTAVRAAHDAFEYGPFGRMGAAERGRLLRRMADVVRQNADALGLLETIDTGKDLQGIQSALRGWLTDSLDYYAGLADKVEGANIPVEATNIFNYTRREPFGVVACITAWNSPLLIAIWKLSAALAAGNTVVLKPSEHASVSTLALAECLQEADLPPGLINVVTGAADTGKALVGHPLVRMVSFTGGVSGGRAVARQAGASPKPVILELGGKSPHIVLKDADLELAARGIVSGIFPPAGQSCIAGSRVLVHHSLHDALVSRIVDLTKGAVVGDPADPGTHIGPIANKPHFQRVRRAIEAARAEGAACALGGGVLRPEGCAGWFVAPTVFTGVRPEMGVARDEIFGPVLAVMPVRDDDDAITLANDSDFGLAAGVWSRDTARAMRVAHHIGAGTVYINTYFGAAPQSPVGGYKASGYGRENGIEGLLAFTQTKSVWLDLAPLQPKPFA